MTRSEEFRLEVSRPLLRRLPRWLAVRAYQRLVQEPFGQNGWAGRTERTELRPHGVSMELRLDDWSERMAYFTGTYYDTEGLQLFEALVKKGDSFVDVGANVGFVSLAASRLVGSGGTVHACEPNPKLQVRLRHAFEANRALNVTLLPIALGQETGHATLDADGHEGTGTLRTTEGSSSVSVEVRRGDDVLPASGAPRMIKVDVEGFEYDVLLGMRESLAAPNVAAYVEVTPDWLAQRGTTADALFALFEERGFRAAFPRRRKSGHLTLRWLTAPLRGVHQYDVVFMREHEVFAQRATPLFQQ